MISAGKFTWKKNPPKRKSQSEFFPMIRKRKMRRKSLNETKQSNESKRKNEKKREKALRNNWRTQIENNNEKHG